MDDIYIGANSEEEMIKNLTLVLDRLFQHNLKIRLSKTKFFVKEIKMLGVIYSPTGKKVDPEKIAAIQKFGEITMFFGYVGVYFEFHTSLQHCL
jgi:hypothetical protein